MSNVSAHKEMTIVVSSPDKSGQPVPQGGRQSDK